jgi:hypothetical protein
MFYIYTAQLIQPYKEMYISVFYNYQPEDSNVVFTGDQ